MVTSGQLIHQYMSVSTQVLKYVVFFSTYSCDCSTGWKGAFCTETVSTCDPEHDPPHQCSKGATCASLPHGYTCFCPLGATGVYCEQGEAELGLMLSTNLSRFPFGKVK